MTTIASGAPRLARLPARVAAFVLGLYPALGQPTFRRLWLGLLPSSLVLQMDVVVRPYVAFSLTGSASMLGVVSLASALPLILLSLVGGVAADRLSGRTVLLCTHLVFLASDAALAYLAFTGGLGLGHVLVVAFALGAAMPFNMPARQAYVARIVGRHDLPNAVALNNAGLNAGRLLGPSIAGLLLAVPGIGIGLVFSVMALLYVIPVATLLRMPADAARAGGADAAGERGMGQLFEGLRYVRDTPAILALLLLAAAMAAVGIQYQTFMTVTAERVYHVGAEGLGLMMAVSGVGALVGALTVATLSRYRRPAQLQVGIGVLFGGGLVAFGLAPSFGIALATLALVGFSSAMYLGLNSTLMMANLPPHLYGRVMSLYLMMFAAQPLGALPLGWLADTAGVQVSMIAAGAVMVLVVLGIGMLYPPYRQLSWSEGSRQSLA